VHLAKSKPMKTILVLANEGIVMAIFRHMLKEYSVIEATNAEEALTLFRNNHRRFDLLLADVTLPTISGTQVALLFRFQNPNLPVILTSDYSVNEWPRRDWIDRERLGPSRTVFLQKPFRAQVLLRAVGELIGTPLPEMERAVYQQGRTVI